MREQAADAPNMARALAQSPGIWVEVRDFLLKNRLGGISFLLIAAVVLAAILADVVAPYDPYQQFTKLILEAPSADHIMGTDSLGRDIYSRVIHGARISLIVGLSSVVLGTVGGAIVGILSAYIGGRTDMYVQRFMDAWMSVPQILLALSIVAALGPGLTNVIIAIGLSGIPRTNRVIRSAVLTVKQNDYVGAARALGSGHGRIMAQHILPNVLPPIMVIASITLGQAILTEASLSFLGLGVPQPAPSWGGMVSGDSRSYMLAAPWMPLFPGLAITATVLGWNLLGDALRDVFDPRLRGSL